MSSKYNYDLDMNDPLLKELLRQISPNSVVLEFGPAMGRLTSYLKNQMGCQVYIVELDRECFESALQFAEGGICGDAETEAWDKEFANISFDYVIFQDVLEHLRQPAEVLKRTLPLLKEDGKTIICVPNITYAGVAAELMQMKFAYRPLGILDNTHVHFFSYDNVMEMHKLAGFTPVILKGFPNEVENSEFSAEMQALPKSIADYIKDRPGGLWYEFFTIAVKTTYHKKNADLFIDETQKPCESTFLSYLYYDTGQGLNDGKRLDLLTKEGEGLRLEVELPASPQPLSFRWDPAVKRALHCTDVFLLAKGEKVLPDKSTASFTADGEEFFANDEASYFFTLPEGTHSFTIFYSMGIDYIADHYMNGYMKLQEKYKLKQAQLSEEEERHRKYEAEIYMETEYYKNALKTSLERENEAVKTSAEKEKAIVQGMGGQIRELRHQLEHLKISMHQQEVLYKAQIYELSQYKDQLSYMEKSRAWSLTYPLRRLHSSLTGLPMVFAPVPADISSMEQKTEPLVLTPPLGTDPPALDRKVSFIIPTYNGGEELSNLLVHLFGQKGLRELEVIVVDSGSTDGSPEKAEYFGAKVVHIRKEDFTHCYSRNMGAQNASGDYFIFTTQDATPTGPWWARRMLEPLEQGKVVVASCIEKPKEDAELHYRMSIWSHHLVFLGLDGTDKIGTLPEDQNHITLRQNGNLNDIACAVRSDIFMKYRYQTAYAEDLDFGIRMIRAGHQVAFLSSEQVIHSHRRKPYYYLKRAFVEYYNVTEILPDMPLPQIDKKALFSQILGGFIQICLLQEYVESLGTGSITLDELDAHMDDFLWLTQYTNINQLVKEPKQSFGDQDMDQFYQKVLQLYDGNEMDTLGLIPNFRHYYTEYVSKFLRLNQAHVSRADRQEVIDCLVKHYAVLAGVAMYAYVTQNNKDKNNSEIFELADSLNGGV